MVEHITVEEFAKRVADIQNTDRWVFLVADGDMGEGKSCITGQIAAAAARINNIPFSYQENMTFLRDELKVWIDGKDEKKTDQKPERSVILADEIVSMFFKRNWYDSEQIDGIELLNKCRDRHLFVLGNIPNFWDLDSAVYSLVTFWIHVHERGRAWVFMKDRNPFTNDKWHKLDNYKLFGKYNNPYKCKNFICEIRFDDWKPRDKEEYYRVRNLKRVNTEGQRKNSGEKYIRIKRQRNALIKFMVNEKKATAIKVSEMTGLSEGGISDIANNNTPVVESWR